MFKHVVAFDTETFLVGRGEDLAPKLVCATWCHNDADREPGIATALGTEHVFLKIARSGARIVGQNIAFDMHVLLRRFPELQDTVFALYDSGRVVDTMLNQRLLDISQGRLDGFHNPLTGKYQQTYYSLAALHDHYGLGLLEKKDTWRLRYAELDGVPLMMWPKEAVSYAKDDALATLRVYEAQQQFSKQFEDDAAAQARGAFALQRVAIRGMITDGATVESYIKELEQLVHDSGKLLKDAGFIRSNGSRDTGKVKEHMQRVCDEAGVDVRKTATGAVSLDAESCREVQHDALLQAYTLYSTSDTLLTKASALREGSKGLPLQTQFVSLLANGRTSSRIPKEPVVGVNLQNAPRAGKLRSCFIARPGYYFCDIDFDACEIVGLAQCETWLTGSSEMAKALRNKQDLHCVVASQLLGEPYDVCYENKKVGKYAQARQLGKICNFGLAGGMSAATFMKHTNRSAKNPSERITLKQATELRDVWYKTWRMQPYFDAVKGAFGESSWDSILQIKQFVSGRIRGGLTYTEACNSLFSGLCADLNKMVLYECVKASMLAKPGSPFYDCHVVNFVHDSVLLEIPIATATASAKALTELMCSKKQAFLPDVPVTAAPALAERMYKEMSAVWSADGELLPWRPENV
jgi:DNA polymerase I-like protein with 3'-5' exonuclease and polymerase domains